MPINTNYAFDTAAAAAEAYASAGTRSSEMGKEDFLKLLVAQLSNQDPLNPLQGHEFAAQLAQFSTVEQLIGINGAIEAQSDLNGILSQSINSGVAAGLIGRTVEANASKFTLAEGTEPRAGFDLSTGAAEVQVVITNESGQVVRTLHMDGLGAGRHTFEWDGRDQSGARAQAGTYSFEVVATTAGGDSVGASTVVYGPVERVTFTNEGIKLWVSGTPIAMGSVTAVEP